MYQENSNSKPFPLDEWTFLFAKNIVLFCKQLSKDLITHEYIKQLVRSSGSVGANYIEANESLGKKDFAMKIKICRKEAKESEYWLRLLMETTQSKFQAEIDSLIVEANELKKIFSSILSKIKQ